MYDPELDRFKRDVHLLRYAVERHGYQRNKLKSTRSSHVLGHPRLSFRRDSPSGGKDWNDVLQSNRPRSLAEGKGR